MFGDGLDGGASAVVECFDRLGDHDGISGLRRSSCFLRGHGEERKVWAGAEEGSASNEGAAEAGESWEDEENDGGKNRTAVKLEGVVEWRQRRRGGGCA